MINLVFWLLTLAGVVALLAFAWHSAMRRRGWRLVDMLQSEGVLRHAVSVPVQVGGRAAPRIPRRGTVVLTKRRIAGFTHRTRFVLVRGGGTRAGSVAERDGWLVVRPAGPGSEVRFRVGDAVSWARDAARVLRS